MTGARRDLTYFILGLSVAHIYDDAVRHGDLVVIAGDIIAGAVTLALVWLVTGWRIARRNEPL